MTVDYENPEILLKEFGKFFREKRIKSEKSQLCVAIEIGFKSPQAISRIENGHRALPIARLESAARAIGVDPHDLTAKLIAIHTAKILERRVA